MWYHSPGNHPKNIAMALLYCFYAKFMFSDIYDFSNFFLMDFFSLKCGAEYVVLNLSEKNVITNSGAF